MPAARTSATIARRERNYAKAYGRFLFSQTLCLSVCLYLSVCVFLSHTHTHKYTHTWDQSGCLLCGTRQNCSRIGYDIKRNNDGDMHMCRRRWHGSHGWAEHASFSRQNKLYFGGSSEPAADMTTIMMMMSRARARPGTRPRPLGSIEMSLFFRSQFLPRPVRGNFIVSC